MIYISSETPLAKTKFSFPSGCQMDIASGLGLEPSVSFPLSIGLRVASSSTGSPHAASLWIHVCVCPALSGRQFPWCCLSHLTLTIFLPPLPKIFWKYDSVPNIPLNGKQLPFEADFFLYFFIKYFFCAEADKSFSHFTSLTSFQVMITGKTLVRAPTETHLRHVSALSLSLSLTRNSVSKEERGIWWLSLRLFWHILLEAGSRQSGAHTLVAFLASLDFLF